MKVDGKSVSLGDAVVDKFLGVGKVESFTATGAKISFPAKGEFEYQDGGYLGGVARLGFTRKTFIEIPLEHVEIVTKLLAVYSVTIQQGF